MRFLLLMRSWVVGILLAGAAAFFGYQAYAVWSGDGEPGIDQPAQKKPKARAAGRVAYHRTPRFNAYEVIARKNLFSSDRREQLPDPAPAPAPGRQPKPLDNRFALFGIVIKGDEKEALVSNLDQKTAGDKKYVWVKVGDKVGSFDVAEIQSEQILLTGGGRTYTIRLSDQDHPQKRSGARSNIKRGGTGTRSITIPKVKRPAAKRSKTPS